MLVEKAPTSQGKSTEHFPLTFATRGEWVMLEDIRAGNKLRKRLADLGLYIGMRVRIVQDDLSGPVILAVKNDSRVAVGRGMAQKILVTHAEEQR
jgi:Fe2+ transport system protein FeoA